MKSIIEQWMAVADNLPSLAMGERVRIIGTGVSGLVVSTTPLRIRDGRGCEYEPSRLVVRPVVR